MSLLQTALYKYVYDLVTEQRKEWKTADGETIQVIMGKDTERYFGELWLSQWAPVFVIQFIDSFNGILLMPTDVSGDTQAVAVGGDRMNRCTSVRPIMAPPDGDDGGGERCDRMATHKSPHVADSDTAEGEFHIWAAQ